MGTTVSLHATEDFWRDEKNLDEYLALKLRAGSTSTVLGAGASMGFNLPSWGDLVKRIRESSGAEKPIQAITLEQESDRLFVQKFGRDRALFAKAVRSALYEVVNNNPKFLLSSDLLQAVAAFLTSSLKGSGGAVVNFNFDDILENYLKLLGFVVRSETKMPAWLTSADMLVLHPHGLLPMNSEVGMTNIIFTTTDYTNVIGRPDAWNRTMQEIWSKTFPVFIGLSGDDMRLMSLLDEVKAIHPATIDGSIFWGVRPTVRSEDSYVTEKWKNNGIAPRYVGSYDEIPLWLLSICQRSAAK